MPLCPDAVLNCTLADSSYSGWNCTEFQSCREQADNDIAGLGVLLAFVVTSSITLLIAWVTYIVQPADVDLENDLSMLDMHFLRWIWKIAKNPPKFPSTWVRVLQKTILHLSDSHIVTGLAILTAGFIQSCRLSIYHFHFVVYLGWMASSTHMTTLTVLRKYLRRHRPVLKARVIAMTAMFIMLFVALALISSSVWPGADTDRPLFFDSPLRCAWEQGYMGTFQQDAIFSLCLVTGGFIARLSKLFIRTSEFFRLWLRDRPSSWLKRQFDIAERKAKVSDAAVDRFYWRALATLILGIYVNARSLYDLYESLLCELIWLSFSLLWGFSKIFAWRRTAPVKIYENQWGFGQLVPLLLLLLPIVAIPELYSESKRPDCEDDVEHFHEQASPSIAYTKSDRPPISQANVYIEMTGSLVPITGGLETSTHQASTMPPTDNDSHLLSSNPATPLSRPGSTERVPVQQPNKSARPPLLTEPEFLYGSKAFKFLIFADVGMVAAPFVTLISIMLAGDLQASLIFLRPFTFLVGGVPTVLAPTILWLVFMMPFSHATKR